MLWKIYVLEFITCLLIRIALTENDNYSRTCAYVHTVDLTGVPQQDNGSYIYGDVEIPAEFVNFYSFRILDNGTEIRADTHPRGCICSVKKCLHICSYHLVDFYNEQDNKAVIDSGFIKNITLNNGSIKPSHLIEDFHLIVKSVSKPIALAPELNYNDQWTLFENHSLLRHDDSSVLSQEEYCFNISRFYEDGKIYFLVNPYYGASNRLPWNITINGYFMVSATMFIVVTIVLYISFNKLKHVNDKSLVAYLSSLALSYSLISFLIISRLQLPPMECKIIGYSIYFTCISYVAWNCVLSYQTWSMVTHIVEDSSPFWKYAIVGWLVPLLMTLLAYAAQIFIQDETLTPGINETSCGLNTRRWAASIYLYIPGSLVFIFSLILYIKVLLYLMENKRDVRDCRKDFDKTNKIRFFLYFRLFILMGVSWLLDCLAYFANMILKDRKSDLRVPDLFSATQGLLIFLMFICRGNVWSKIREKIKGRDSHEQQTMALTTVDELG